MKRGKFKLQFGIEVILSLYFLLVFIVSFSYMFYKYIETFFRVFLFGEGFTFFKNATFFKSSLALGWGLYIFILWYFFHVIANLSKDKIVRKVMKVRLKNILPVKNFSYSLSNIFFHSNSRRK